VLGGWGGGVVWTQAEYDATLRRVANLFVENYKNYAQASDPSVAEGGPVL
jgi:uncharacterized protein YraI